MLFDYIDIELLSYFFKLHPTLPVCVLNKLQAQIYQTTTLRCEMCPNGRIISRLAELLFIFPMAVLSVCRIPSFSKQGLVYWNKLKSDGNADVVVFSGFYCNLLPFYLMFELPMNVDKTTKRVRKKWSWEQNSWKSQTLCRILSISILQLLHLSYKISKTSIVELSA